MRMLLRLVQRPVATTLLWLGVVLAGLLAHQHLPIAPLPKIEFPIISVSASMPGASPEVMASSVAMPLERALGAIAGVNEMTSRSREGTTRITLQFDLKRDINSAATDVQAAINAARSSLPSGLRSNPSYRKVNPAAAPIITLALTSKTLTQEQLYEVAANVVEQRLAQIDGVGEVQVAGSSLPAVRIDLNPDALTQQGISLETVRAAVSAANSISPRGVLESDQQRWQIRVKASLTKAADYRPLIVAYRNGAPVRLQDVATVEDSLESINNVGYFNDQRAVLVLVRPQANANIIATVDQVRADLPVLRAMLPVDVTVDVAQDRTPGIRASVFEAQLTLVIAIVLVAAVVLLFLRDWRAALIPTLAVPVSLVGTFGAMYLLDFSINTMSLMALIVATGFVVDDAIVVLENILRYRERGMSPLRAALRGTREVGFTVLSMSLSLVAVFIPMLLLGGLPGRLFHEFAVTLSISILISLLVSLTMTPMLAAHWLRKQTGPVRVEPRRGFLGGTVAVIMAATSRQLGAGFDALTRGYDKSLQWVLRHGRLTLLMLLATVGLNVYLYGVVPKSFFPSQDIGLLVGFFSVDDGTSFAATEPKLNRFRQILMADPAVSTVTAFAGGGPGGAGGNSFLAIQLKPLAERNLSAQKIIQRLRPQLGNVPGARLFLVAAQDIRVGGRQSSSAYQYSLLATDLSDLKTWLPRVQRMMADLPELVDVESDVEDKGRQASISIDRDAAARLGVSMATIAAALNNSFSQRQVSVIYGPLNQYRVVFEVADQHAVDVESLRKMHVISAQGKRVPLTAFATLSSRNAPLSVNHQGLFAADTISFDLAPGVSLGQAIDAINQGVASIGLPSDRIQAGFQGTAGALQSALANLGWLVLAALVTMYIVLGILYESTIHPLTILSTLPSAGVGALLALIMLKAEFTLIAFIGLFLLIGIVNKNAIMMVDFALDAQRKRGLLPADAIRQACLTRFRPILMTTLSAIAGAVPLILATGAGVEIRQPLGITIVGGLLVSQVLTLYTTPVVYLYLDTLSQRVAGRRSPTSAPHKPNPAMNLPSQP